LVREFGIEAIQPVRLLAMLRVRGMTVEHLSRLSGISDRTINRINQDPSYSPQDGTWVKLAHILRCDKDWLSKGEGAPMNTPDGRVALIMAAKGWDAEDLHQAIKGSVPLETIREFLDGHLPVDEQTSIQVSLYASVLDSDARWILYGSSPNSSSASRPFKETVRLAEAVKEALPGGVDADKIALKIVDLYFRKN